MNFFHYRNNQLFAEEIDLAQIAQSVGTPCYVYSRATIERHWNVFDDALKNHPHLICYSVKANSNIAVLNVLARLGSGFDIVSGGELKRVLKAHGDPNKVVFSGVGKTQEEMQFALRQNIHCFNVESIAELDLLNKVAVRENKTAPVSLRVNPDVDPQTHPYISTGLKENKFGIESAKIIEAYQYAMSLSNLKIHGIDCHIGSQLTNIDPFVEALSRLQDLLHKLNELGIAIEHLDLGGGLGIPYQNETPPSPHDYAVALGNNIKDKNLNIIIEPGRVIVGNAGILLTKVQYLKQNEQKHFAIVDAGMNDLMRPSLYNAWQDIIPVTKKTEGKSKYYDVVGPICETGDFLGKHRELNLQQDDLLAVCSSGAYGFAMSSNYNSRPRPAEVMVDGESMHIIRTRESFGDLIRGEMLIP